MVPVTDMNGRELFFGTRVAYAALVRKHALQRTGVAVRFDAFRGVLVKGDQTGRSSWQAPETLVTIKDQ